jgi:hypothetical protein
MPDRPPAFLISPFFAESRPLPFRSGKTVIQSMDFLPPCACLCALALAACAARDTVRIPRRDGTPPQAALDVVGQGNTWVLTEGKPPVVLELGADDSLVLIGLGEDRDGGVKDMSLTGNAVAVCRGEGGGDRMHSDSFVRRSVIPEFPAGVRVQGMKSARIILRMADFRKLCGNGEMKALTGAAGVRIVNFHGGSAVSPTVQFKFEQPEAATVEPAPAKPGARTQRRSSHPSQALPKSQTAEAGRTL